VPVLDAVCTPSSEFDGATPRYSKTLSRIVADIPVDTVMLLVPAAMFSA
jgi:hypothetical protein